MIKDFFLELNNREIAIVFWFFLFGLYGITKAPKAALRLLKSVFNYQLVATYSVCVIYLYFCIDLFISFGIWENYLIKDCIIWLISFAIINSFKTSGIKTTSDFWKFFIVIFTWTTLIQFFSNLYTFSILQEILFVSIFSIIIFIKSYYENYLDNPSHKIAARFFEKVITIILILLFCYQFYMLLDNWDDFWRIKTIKTFTLSPILSVLFIPFLYYIFLMNQYHDFFIQLDYRYDSSNYKLKLAIIINSFYSINKIVSLDKILIENRFKLQDNGVQIFVNELKKY